MAYNFGLLQKVRKKVKTNLHNIAEIILHIIGYFRLLTNELIECNSRLDPNGQLLLIIQQHCSQHIATLLKVNIFFEFDSKFLF